MTRLALISDVHMRDEHAPMLREELERVVDAFEAFDPARAFVLGDLIEDGSSAAADRENVRRVRSILDSCSFPVTYLLGNHDVENLTRSELSDLLDQKSFRGSVDVDGTRVIYLDSSWEPADGARGRLGPRQREWLADRLREVSDALVFVHHPLGFFDVSDNEWFGEYPERAFLGDRKEVLELFAEIGGVRGTVSGHIHQHGFSRFYGLPHVSVNAFSKELPDVPFTGTYAEVTVDADVEVDVRTDAGTTAAHTLD